MTHGKRDEKANLREGDLNCEERRVLRVKQVVVGEKISMRMRNTISNAWGLVDWWKRKRDVSQL